MVCRRITSFGHSMVALALLALGGMALYPLSSTLQRAEREAGLSMPLPAFADGRDALAEQLSFFTLGGLRSLAAEILTLDATSAWMERDWSRAERRWQMITTLCPQRPNYWISASRDMAINAAADAMNDSGLSLREQENLARSYFARGERFLQDGIAHNPDSALLYMNLGDLYTNLHRRPDFAKAAAAYHKAVELGASALYRRQEFYSLCRIRGREQDAWKLGRELYETPQQRMPSLKCLLFVLQNKVHVDEHEKLSPEQLFGSSEKAHAELARFSHNTLRFPVNGIKQYLGGAH